MERKEIEKAKFRVGKILHAYRTKYGQERFEKLLERLSWSMIDEFDQQTAISGLRVIEAEYAAFDYRVQEKLKRFENKEDIK